MKNFMSHKAYGVWFVLATALVAAFSFVRYMNWAPAHNTTDQTIVIALIAGIVLDIVLLLKDEDMLIILATACYAYAVGRLLTGQVGSFVDAFQGVKLFGDATQVGNIISIAEFMAACVILTIISGFLKREK